MWGFPEHTAFRESDASAAVVDSFPRFGKVPDPSYPGTELVEVFRLLVRIRGEATATRDGGSTTRPGSPEPTASREAVYTQTTDVEIEVNGLLTYDRALVKPDAKRTTEANKRVYLPPPLTRTIVPTSEKEGLQWRFTMSAPAAGWEKPDFDDSGWQKGPAGFGTRGTPGAVVRTEWTTEENWVRRVVELPAAPSFPPRVAPP